MSATVQRDRVCTLAKSNPKKALDQARAISDPWFRAQALSWVARFTGDDPSAAAREAAEAAGECDDDYQKSAVRAWEIAALAERSCITEARKRLKEALERAKIVIPASSRSEALFLLMEAALRIGPEEAAEVYQTLKMSCGSDEHWRCKRALRNGAKVISGELQPRSFFW